MPALIQQLMEQIDSRVLRERALIFISLLAVIFILWDLLLQSTIDQTGKKLQAEQAQLLSDQQALDTKIATLTLAMASDPAIGKRKEIEAFATKISAIETQLAGMSQGLISAEQLPQVLQDVLARTQSVTLLQVRTLTATEIQLSSVSGMGVVDSSVATQEKAATASAAPTGTGVYKHSVLIRVEGNYSELVKLLQDIEALPWRFYWESLDYTVSQYPQAEIDIQVFTLSSEEGLLGV
jgi:MSHA biogenesis protein MshJ